MSFFSLLTFVYLFFHISDSVCPFLLQGTPILVPDPHIPSDPVYNEALETLDIVAVFDDIYNVMLTSQECFPADIFNNEQSYAGLFIRLAWHCAGTFRSTDGKGGCAGGRQRFSPEASWEDNVNLDKARALLAPIKNKYGDALSWGDLFIFAGTAGILQGGGPISEVCAGRIDDVDGELSEPLNDESNCPTPGNCQRPLGSSTVGLIYVNPEGFEGNPDPSRSAIQVREIFSRMGMNDSETVALIGGGHAFGKCHGPCPNGPGPGPEEQPENPWPQGLCGNNLPFDTYTSGIEGQWTTYPFRWDNQYFRLLANQLDKYELITGPGNKYQWRNTNNGLLMLTTDIAFMYDENYANIVRDYANNIDLLNHYFSHSWAKLTASGGRMASNSFCVRGDDVAPRRDSCPSQKSISYTKRAMRKCRRRNRGRNDRGRNRDSRSDSSKSSTSSRSSRGWSSSSSDDDYKGRSLRSRYDSENSDYTYDDSSKENNDCRNERCKRGEFKFNNDYECEKCQDIFGDSCMYCRNYIGCYRCKYGYERVKDSCGLWYCRPRDY